MWGSLWTQVSEGFSKRLLQFVLKQTVGRYLDVERDLSERLSLELSAGVIQLANVKVKQDVRFIPGLFLLKKNSRLRIH